MNYFAAENWFNDAVFNPVELVAGMVTGIILYQVAKRIYRAVR